MFGNRPTWVGSHPLASRIAMVLAHDAGPLLLWLLHEASRRFRVWSLGFSASEHGAEVGSHSIEDIYNPAHDRKQ